VNRYGRIINYYNKDSIFIGLSPELYAEKNGNFVFSVALKKKFLENLNTDIIDKDTYPYFSDEEYIYIKLDRKILTEEKRERELASRVVDIIKNVFLNALSRSQKVRNLIESASKSILDEIGKIKVGFTLGGPQNNPDGQGWYIYYNNKDSIFIGLSSGIDDEQTEDLGFAVSLKDLETKNIDYSKYSCVPDDEWIHIRLDRNILVDENPKEKLTSAVVDIIKNVFLKNV
jgi:hypothetical protein